MSKKALEKHPLFPYIAWVLVFCFSVFVFTIVQDLKRTADQLSQYSNNLEQKANKDVLQINFENNSPVSE